jgi:hypothetical protein
LHSFPLPHFSFKTFSSFLYFINLHVTLPPSLSLSPKLQSLHSHHRNFLSPNHRWLSLIFVFGDLLKRPESFSVQFPIFFPGYWSGINRVNYNWLVSYFPSSKDSLTCVSNERWEIFPSFNINILNFYPFASYGETLISFLLFFPFWGDGLNSVFNQNFEKCKMFVWFSVYLSSAISERFIQFSLSLSLTHSLSLSITVLLVFHIRDINLPK